jgi:hypothetical protein
VCVWERELRKGVCVRECVSVCERGFACDTV